MNNESFIPSDLWKRKVRTFDELVRYIKPKPIVLVGDSIIQHFRISEFIPGYYFINRGIGDDTLTGLLLRLKSSVLDLNPEKVFIHIGLNDLPIKKDEEILSNYKDMLIEIIANNPSTVIFAISILPTSGYPDKRTTRISYINSEIEKLTKSLELNFINAFPLFCDINEELKPEFSNDGLNLNQAGYNLLAKTIKNYL